MMHYIFWPNGVLEIRRDGRAVYFGHPVKGLAMWGNPGTADKVTRDFV